MQYLAENICVGVFLLVNLQVCNFIKQRLQHRCFPGNFSKLLRTYILQNTSGANVSEDKKSYIFSLIRSVKLKFNINFSILDTINSKTVQVLISLEPVTVSIVSILSKLPVSVALYNSRREGSMSTQKTYSELSISTTEYDCSQLT